ncbi:MAG: protoglobin domain-containing protein, partial [Alphaproteobacteria bacterium]
MSRLVSAQTAHWGRLFNGRFDEAYIQGVRTIGTVHNRIGLEPRWYIGGYALVLSDLTDLAIRTYRWKAKRLGEVITAVNSAVMLDMDFAISVYQEAGIEDRQKVIVEI